MLKIETVEETVYLEVNALEGYARKEYVDDAIDGVNSSISNIETDVSAINSELENKASKSDLEGLATERYVDEKINNIPEVDLTPYATTESVNEKLKLKADVSDLDSLATKEELNLKADKNEVLYPSDIEGLATESYVDTKFNSIDLSPYATKEELEDKADISYVDDKIAGIEIPSIEGLATEEYVNNKVNSIDLSEYATEQYVDSEISKIYVPSLDGYATEEYVDNEVSSIDLSEYALTSDLSSAIESINSDLDLKADKSDLKGLATEDYVNEKIDEKEVGITEPELIGKSVGHGLWIREGGHGIGSQAQNITDADTNSGGLYREGYDGILRITRSSNLTGWEIRNSYLSDDIRFRRFRSSAGGWQKEVIMRTDANTFPDSNGVLHSSRNPIDTLNTSDMADTVADNDLLTVTSGAVYRAITKLQNKIDELEGQVNELKALYE